MALSWRRVLTIGVLLVAMGALGGSVAISLVRAVCGLSLLGLGYMRLHGHKGPASKPWKYILGAGVAALVSAVIRLIHAAIANVDYPYPSPADLVAYSSYGLMIVGGITFVRARTIERHRSDLVDSIVVATLAALLIYAFVVSDYLIDASIPLPERVGQLVYTLLTITLIGVTARASFGPGERNGSYYLMAAAVGLIVFNDILLLLDTVGSSGAYETASVVAPLAFVSASASIVHPGALALADRPRYREQQLSTRRVALLLVAVASGPSLLIISRLRDNTQHLLVLLALWIVVAFSVLFRMVLLVLDREAVTEQERSLRDLAATLTQLDGSSEMIEASLEVSLGLLDRSDSARSAMYHVNPDGSWSVIGAVGAHAERMRSVTLSPEAAGELERTVASGRVNTLELTETLESSMSRTLAQAGSFIALAPVVSRHGGKQVLVVTSTRLIRRDQAAALGSLTSQLSLALDGVVAREDQHQRRSNRRFRALVENSSDVVLVVNVDAEVRFASPTVRRLLGRPESDVVGKPLLDLVHRPDQARVERLLAEAARGVTRHRPIEVRLLHGDRELRWFEVEASDLTAEAEVQGLVVTASDISDRKRAELQLQRSEARFRLMVQNSSDVVAIIDETGFFTYVSPSVERMLGFKPADVLGRQVFEMLSVTEAERMRGASIVSLNGSSIDVRVQAVGGSVRALEVGVTDMRHAPEVDGVVLNIRDVTDRKSLEDDLRHQALHDDLTGLGNRTLFAERLRDVLASDDKKARMVAVLFIDLDDFKLINDTLGHVVGDQVLVSVAERIRQCLRLTDVAARLGGDEFAVQLSGVYSDSEIAVVTERIRSAIAEPLTVAGQLLHVTASIGVAAELDGRQSADDLLRSADLAMYQAKEAGKDRYELFEDHMQVSVLQEMELKSALARAIENDEFVLHYQPIFDMETGRSLGAEALIRWEDPYRGMVSPNSFIPAAEETGLIHPIGLWVIKQACTDLASWRAAGHDLYVSINVSGRQLNDDSFADQLVEIVRAQGVPPTSVVIELTESVLADQGASVAFGALHELGFRIALDDFGTGYSALQYLQSFPIDLIKIDRSFVKAMNTTADIGVVQAVLDVAKRINAKTVAEGIEAGNELRLLRDLGVELGQGYYFSRPVPNAAFLEIVQAELVGES